MIEVVKDDEGLWVAVEYRTDDIRDYDVRYFASAFSDASLPPALWERVDREAGPAYERRLDTLRAKIEAEPSLEFGELFWLGSGNHIAELDRYLLLHGDAWPVAKIAAFWRNAGVPERNLAVTTHATRVPSPLPQDSPIWTTRGAALADLERMEDAEACARRAAALSPESYHPQNLLGRVYGFLGRQSDSEAAFERARSLGAPQGEVLRAELRGRHGRKRGWTDRKSGARPEPDHGSVLPEEEVPF